MGHVANPLTCYATHWATTLWSVAGHFADNSNCVKTATKQYAALIFACVLFISLATAALLRSQGRLYWCACGSIIPWSFQIQSKHNSQHILDPYTFSHILHGVIFFGMLWFFRKHLSAGWRLVAACTIEAAWELLENSPIIIERYRSATASVLYSGDSIANSVADIAWCALGFLLAMHLGLWKSILLIAVFEIGCLLWVRDNLTLNVIMLLYPIDAIRTWQVG